MTKEKTLIVRVNKKLYDRTEYLARKLQVSKGEIQRLALNELLDKCKRLEREVKARGK